MFDDQPADASRPAGLLHGVVPIAPTTGDGALATDLANLAQGIADAGILPRILSSWLAQPRRRN